AFSFQLPGSRIPDPARRQPRVASREPRVASIERVYSIVGRVSSPGVPSTADVRDYWNRHIHDLEITTHPVGSPGFFADLDQYHFEKLHHLLRLVDFNAYAGRRVLEVGCGAGTDIARFAKGGAIVSGVDLSSSAIALAKTNFEHQRLGGVLREAAGGQR